MANKLGYCNFMNRSDLVPTVIVDKNNKTTTVHKRAGSAVSSAASVPPPSLASKKVPTRGVSIKRCRKLVNTIGEFDYTNKLLALNYIEGMGAASLHNVADLLEQRTPSYQMFVTLGSLGDKLAEDDLIEYTSLMKDNYYRIADAIGETHENPTISSGFIRGLQKLQVEYPEITPEQGAAIMDALAGIYYGTRDNDEYPTTLMWVGRDREDGERMLFVMNSRDLREHIMEHPEDSSRVSELMNHNPNLREPELMHLLRNPNASSSLADGAL